VAKTITVVIQEDPRKTHRPVEALRIALGLVAGSHQTTVILLGEAFRLLTDETDDIIDVDILEKYLPSIAQLKIPFILQPSSNQPTVRSEFQVQYDTDDRIADFVQSADCALIF
jgi:sulfur relay (sulfurtransferase) DsrF/TusC family protein